MAATKLSNTSDGQIVCDSLNTNGYAIIDRLASNDVMDRLASEMNPYIEQSPFGIDNFVGALTKRTGSLIARSPTARDLIMNPLILDTVGKFLERSTTFQLHLTQIISIHPGSPAQPLHRDEAAWDFFPFPLDFQVQCNVLWALTDYTAEMGATRIAPGSHLSPDDTAQPENVIAAEMERGSALLYTGKVLHGAGENRSNKVRQAINITYAVGWVRQEENQYLSTPQDIAKDLPDDLLRLMGYQMACFGLGYVNDCKDPLSVLRPENNIPALSVTQVKHQAGFSSSAASLLDAIIEVADE